MERKDHLSEIERPEIAGEKTLYEKGSFKRVRRWYKGLHPEKGILHLRGISGKETIAIEERIRPQGTYVVEKEK